MRYVVLPQAIRRVIPPLLNDFIGLQKDTALVSVLGVTEALRRAQIYSAQYVQLLELVVRGLPVHPDHDPAGSFHRLAGRARRRRRQAGRGVDVTEAVRIEGLHKSFGELEVLRGIDLDGRRARGRVPDRRIGSGKSTLLRCINLLEPIDAGRILIEGEEITAPGST